MSKKEVSFLPFHALSHFMRDDFRQTVIRRTMNALSDLPDGLRANIDKQTKRFVTVPGFRNSVKAPVGLKIRAMNDAFEKRADLVGALLAGWVETHAELRQQVYDLLTERGWEVLPLDADRTKLPGFLTVWPANEDFEVLNEAYKAKYPDESEVTTDDVSLMAVWISTRLPLEVEGEENDEEGEEDTEEETGEND
ncbi:MAG: hypothetical protein H6636_04790 [Anaerolineales bacterium]|nr:hypothetical protein [Anaerolineales bacterium]